MGCFIQKSSCCFKIQISTVFVIIILFLSASNARFMPQGGSITKLIDNDTQVIETEENMAINHVMVGSRPPRCESMKYCRKCGKCEAIQVPIISPRKSTNTRKDDISNYKPMFWKCKCGDVTFNP